VNPRLFRVIGDCASELASGVIIIAEADEWLEHNRPIPHEEVLAEFGLTVADWEKIGREPLLEETP
jgi:hypothetical protein